MRAEGYEIKWTETRKNITYTTTDGKKRCDDKLHEEKYLKGNMENEFRIREEILRAAQKTGNRATENRLKGRAFGNGFGAELESDNRFAGISFGDVESASSEAGCSVDRRQNSGLYESAAEYSDRVDRENDGRGSELREVGPSDTAGFSAEDNSGSDGIYRKNEDGNLEYVLTGWENERIIFNGFIDAEGRDEAFYQAAVSDYSDPISLIGRGISLAVEAGSIIENDHPVQDSTTIHYPQKKKKEQQSGPVTGGM